MKTNKLFGIVSLMIFAVLAAGLVNAVPTIDRVEVDGTSVNMNQVNYLSVQTGTSIPIDVWLTSTESNSNVQVEAFITGYEHSDTSVSDKTDLFRVEPNATYKKTLAISLPADAKSDKYSLRIIVSDRNGQERIQDYNLVFDMPRHEVTVKDVIFYPDGSVQAGQALLTTVRLHNYGQKDETDVKVTVSIPQLGVSASGYINKIKSDDEESTEELYIRVPSNAQAGTYQVKIDAWYEDGHSTVSKSYTTDVFAAPAPAVAAQPVVVQTAQPVPVAAEKSMLRSVLEGVLLVLVGLLVIVAIILGVSKLSSRDE